MARMFGTDGVRGIANIELTVELAMKLGQAAAVTLGKDFARPKVLIGRDTRISGDMLEAALTAGLCSMGADVTSAGVIPTPGISYLTGRLGFDAGVVISASHNPVQYNGIKFFNRDGLKLSDELEDEIQMNLGVPPAYLPSGKDVGTQKTDLSLANLYQKFLAGQNTHDLTRLTIVTDCSNGAASRIACPLFEGMGATVHGIYHTPDGVNINDHCGSTHPDNLVKMVTKMGADIGLAFDGDADRLIACDETGRILDGDRILGIIALDQKKKGTLVKDTLVVTVMSNLGLLKAMEQQGIGVVRTNVGDRYVMEAMQKDGYALGGEQSGHVLITDRSVSGDGMQTAIALLSIMAETQKPLSQLADDIPIYPQVLLNAHVGPVMKNKYQEVPQIAALIREIEEEYREKGRLLVRTSGTEHLIRVMLEGPDQLEMEKRARDLTQLMETLLTE